MAQLMPLSLTVSCSSKIQIGFTFLVPAYPGCPGKEAVKWLCNVYGGFTVDLDCICGSAYTIATACTQWVTLSFAETKVSNQMTLTFT